MKIQNFKCSQKVLDTIEEAYFYDNEITLNLKITGKIKKFSTGNINHFFIEDDIKLDDLLEKDLIVDLKLIRCRNKSLQSLPW